ncbi:MAG TPA: hypothetical protein VHE08_04385 [Solirubrobacterales bacterium]|nr:hypothetical protein [Solirubrobacterales bacterium]
MASNIKDKETEALVAEIAALTGETNLLFVGDDFAQTDLEAA